MKISWKRTTTSDKDYRTPANELGLADALSLNGQCDIAMERLAAVRQMTNDKASMLRESWMALSYHLCNEQDLYARSVERLEANLAEDGVGDPRYIAMVESLNFPAIEH